MAQPRETGSWALERNPELLFAVSEDGAWVAAGDVGLTALRTDTGERTALTPDRPGDPRHGKPDGFSAIALSPVRSHIAVGWDHSPAQVLDLETGRAICNCAVDEAYGEVERLAFSADGDRLAAFTSDDMSHLPDRLDVLDASTGTTSEVRSARWEPTGWGPGPDHRRVVLGFALSPDGQRFAAGTAAGVVFVSSLSGDIEWRDDELGGRVAAVEYCPGSRGGRPMIADPSAVPQGGDRSPGRRSQKTGVRLIAAATRWQRRDHLVAGGSPPIGQGRHVSGYYPRPNLRRNAMPP